MFDPGYRRPNRHQQRWSCSACRPEAVLRGVATRGVRHFYTRRLRHPGRPDLAPGAGSPRFAAGSDASPDAPAARKSL